MCFFVPAMQAYWPFHRQECKKNEFADQIESSEPKFAEWMRQHGKLAVLKDDEVDRLERASQAQSGPNRQEVMEAMYGRLDPSPAGEVLIFRQGCVLFGGAKCHRLNCLLYLQDLLTRWRSERP